MIETYQHSGRVAPSGLITLPAWLAAAGVLGAAYQFLSMVIPLLIVSALLVFGGGAALMYLVERMTYIGRWRNRALAYGAALLMAVAALAAGYYTMASKLRSEAVAEFAKGNAEVAAQMAEQIDFKTIMEARIETGWTISKRGNNGAQINGIGVWAVWAFEAVTFLVFAFMGANNRLQHVYCEETQRWLEPQPWFAIDAPHAAAVAELRKAQDVQELLAPPPAADPASPITHLVYTLAQTEAPEAPKYLTIADVRIKFDKEGKESKTEKVLWRNVLLADEHAAVLANWLAAKAGPPPEPPAAPAAG